VTDQLKITTTKEEFLAKDRGIGIGYLGAGYCVK